MRLEAEFVIQDGEAGPRRYGIRIDVCGVLQTDWTSNWIGWHCENMAKSLISGVRQAKNDGKLWDGAYLTTLPNDQERKAP